MDILNLEFLSVWYTCRMVLHSKYNYINSWESCRCQIHMGVIQVWVYAYILCHLHCSMIYTDLSPLYNAVTCTIISGRRSNTFMLRLMIFIKQEWSRWLWQVCNHTQIALCSFSQFDLNYISFLINTTTFCEVIWSITLTKSFATLERASFSEKDIFHLSSYMTSLLDNLLVYYVLFVIDQLQYEIPSQMKMHQKILPKTT